MLNRGCSWRWDGVLCVIPILLALVLVVPVRAQQAADTGFDPRITDPRTPSGTGPRILIDGGHTNFHTLDGRYAPFAAVCRADGYRVAGSTTALTPELLAEVDLLVIANALHPRNAEDWSLPTPNAFTPQEVMLIREWVGAGGGLLLIADHMPFPGAVESLAEAFGVRYRNGFVVIGAQRNRLVFARESGSLASHVVTGDPLAPLQRVATFMGSALTGEDLTPLLILPEGAVSLEPAVAWQFEQDTAQTDVAGWYQGAVDTYGNGRAAFFAEAAMFTSQRQGNGPVMGLGSPEAEENLELLRNLLAWLTPIQDAPAAAPANGGR